MEEKEMTIEQMWQKGVEARKAAKALQQKWQTTTDPVERKEIGRQMNDLFAQAKSWKSKAKMLHGLKESIEREFNSIMANLEDD